MNRLISQQAQRSVSLGREEKRNPKQPSSNNNNSQKRSSRASLWKRESWFYLLSHFKTRRTNPSSPSLSGSSRNGRVLFWWRCFVGPLWFFLLDINTNTNLLFVRDKTFGVSETKSKLEHFSDWEKLVGLASRSSSRQKQRQTEGYRYREVRREDREAFIANHHWPIKLSEMKAKGRKRKFSRLISRRGRIFYSTCLLFGLSLKFYTFILYPIFLYLSS